MVSIFIVTALATLLVVSLIEKKKCMYYILRKSGNVHDYQCFKTLKFSAKSQQTKFFSTLNPKMHTNWYIKYYIISTFCVVHDISYPQILPTIPTTCA